MKAILIIDMPNDVSLDEWYAFVTVDRLKATEEELMQGIPFDESKTFKFVPLRPIPNEACERLVEGLDAIEKMKSVEVRVVRRTE